MGTRGLECCRLSRDEWGWLDDRARRDAQARFGVASRETVATGDASVPDGALWGGSGGATEILRWALSAVWKHTKSQPSRGAHISSAGPALCRF